MNLTLNRFIKSNKGILGELKIADNRLAFTLEHPALFTPLGIYPCEKHNGKKFQNVWALLGVPFEDDHSILIHHGNTMLDTKGCILVGASPSIIKLNSGYYTGVLQSRITLDSLRQKLPDNFILEITETF